MAFRRLSSPRLGSNEKRLSWRCLLLGLVAATLIPIGIHTVLLDYLGVPYPDALPHAGLAIVPDHVLLAVGLLVTDLVLRRRGMSLASRLTFLVLTTAAINQALFRVPIMRNIVSTKWTVFPFIDNLPDLGRIVLMVVAAVGLNAALRSRAAKATGAIAATAIIDLWLSPLVHQSFAGIIAANAKREGDQLYTIPYDWHVDLPSYLTSIEPAVGALFVAFALRKAIVPAWTSVAVIFALQAGPLFRVGLNTVYAPSGVGLAILSEAQFMFQSIALAMIVVATAHRSVGHSSA